MRLRVKDDVHSDVADPSQWPAGSTASNRTDCEKRAVALYLQSAAQGNADALLKVGDSYYYGGGGLPLDKKEAALYYQGAADQRNTHALFNLGLMHEIGDGVPQDFHLAKRLFDQAAEFDESARLPRAFAVLMLQSHMFAESLVGARLMSQLMPSLRLAWQELSSVKSWPVVRDAVARMQPLGHLVGRASDILDFRGDNSNNTGLNNNPSAGVEVDVVLLLVAVISMVYVNSWRNARRRRRQAAAAAVNVPRNNR